MIDQIVSKAVGIDLGTTNSAVAVMDPTDTDIVLHRDERSRAQTTPSCVWKDPRSGELVVGSKAFRRIGTNPEPVRSIKRQMGKRRTVLVTDEELAPEQVSAAILAEMRRQIEQDVAGWNTPSMSWVVDRAVVTVPAHFDQPSIDATRQAAEQAGLQLIDLLHEPTAAASYYCWRTGVSDGVFLVYDFGGGTFDASVVRCTAGAFEVLGLSGNMWLGGDDIDAELARHLQQELVDEGYALELDLQDDPEDRIRFTQLRFLVEGMKKALSTQTEYMQSDHATIRDKNGEPVVISRLWERAEVDEVIRPVVERTIPYCVEAIEHATARGGVTLADVDQVILTGGSSHIPLVRDLVRSTLCVAEPGAAGGPRARCAEPVYDKVDTAVALGAAVRAAAAGLVVCNPQRTVRITLRGTGTTGAAQTGIGGRVEPLETSVDLAGGQVRLTAVDYEDEVDLGADGRFGFTHVPLQPGAENPLTLDVFDGAGDLVATAGRRIRQSGESRSLPSGPAVLAKAFLLEVDRGGQHQLKELVPALAMLPHQADFTFSHPGDTDTVLLAMYQGQRKIREVQVSVPPATPRGTPIRLEVEVDELSFIAVTGSVGETTFHASVELPPDRPVPTGEEREELERSFGNAVQYLPAGEREVAKARWRQAKKRFETAERAGEPSMAVHEYEAMEAVIAEVGSPAPVLDPPKDQFDKLVHLCRELNAYLAHTADRPGHQLDHQDIARSIDTLSDQGERAYQDSDQRSYADAIGMLEGLRRHLVSHYQDANDGADPRSETERVTDMVEQVTEEAAHVLRAAAAQERPDIRDEVEAIQRELAELARHAAQDPRGAQNRAAQLESRLTQLRNVLRGQGGGGGTPGLPVDHTPEDTP
jgi:molecular chaperone DnaK